MKSRVFAPGFCRQMVELAKAGGNMRELAREFGCYKANSSARVNSRQANANEMSGKSASAISWT